MRSRLAIALAAVLSLSLLAATCVAEAQSGGGMRRVALVYTSVPVSEMAGPEASHPSAREFMDALRKRGWVEGQNLILERRSAEGRPERYETILQELVGLKCDLIITTGTPMARIAQKVVARRVPILMTAVSDPVVSGLVSSLARPGKNMTGVTADTGPEIEGKRIDLLKQALPTATRVVVFRVTSSASAFLSPTSPTRKAQENAAVALGIKLVPVDFGPEDQTSAFSLITREQPDAVLIGNHLFANAKRHVIVDFTTRNRLPLITGDPIITDAGGLMSYGPSSVEVIRIIADYADRILRGANAGDLPIWQPTTLELVINLKTAKLLGLTLPEALLLRADKVIR